MTALQFASFCIAITAALYVAAGIGYALSGRVPMCVVFCIYAASNVALLWAGMR